MLNRGTDPRPDYEQANDSNQDHNYEYSLAMIDNHGNNSGSLLFHVELQDVNERPISNSGTRFSIDENQTFVATIPASDPDIGQTLTYSIDTLSPGHPDGVDFNIDPQTGALSFRTPPDYENPTDRETPAPRTDEGDNVYLVKIIVTDNGTPALSRDINISVTVNDVVNEGGSSAGGGGGKSGKNHHRQSALKACKDSRALNFSNVGQHDQSLCVYLEEKESLKEKNGEVEREKNRGLDKKAEVKSCLSILAYEKLLAFGQVGQEVKTLQKYLKEQGINPGPIDGIFGRLTKKAVKEWQRKLGVVSDGIVGPKTRAALKKSCQN